jgi:hypothetical protein
MRQLLLASAAALGKALTAVSCVPSFLISALACRESPTAKKRKHRGRSRGIERLSAESLASAGRDCDGLEKKNSRQYTQQIS